MDSFAEATWYTAYLLQMLALLAGVGLACILVLSTCCEILRRNLEERQRRESTDRKALEVGLIGTRNAR